MAQPQYFFLMDENSQIRRTGHQRDIQIHPASPIYGHISDYHRLAVSLAKPNNLGNVLCFFQLNFLQEETTFGP
jgi:hypothetical protein